MSGLIDIDIIRACVMSCINKEGQELLKKTYKIFGEMAGANAPEPKPKSGVEIAKSRLKKIGAKINGRARKNNA